MSYDNTENSRLFQPHYSNRKDYQTNAPSYYDYLAETNDNFKQLYKDIANAVDVDLAKELKLAMDSVSKELLVLSKEEISPKRWQYTLGAKRDNTKENLISNDDGTITIKRDGDKTIIKAISSQILNKLNVQHGEGVIVERSGNTVTIKVDFTNVQRKLVDSDTVKVDNSKNNLNISFDTVQEKLQAGDNIEIKGNIIRAVGDANVSTKQDKITKFTNSALFGSELIGLQAEGKVVTTNIGYLRKSGTYFINGDNAVTTTESGTRKNSIDTPSWERGWLIVHSAEGTDSCFQEFIPWHGYGRYFRCGSPITLDGPVEDYDKEYSSLATTEDYYYWSPWQMTVTVNYEDKHIAGLEDSVKFKDIAKGFAGFPQTNMLQGTPNREAGKLYSKNGLYMGDPYKGYITCESKSGRANIKFLPVSSYGDTLHAYASYGIKPDTTISYLLNWRDGKNVVTAYDMARSVAIRETVLPYNGNQSDENWVRSNANVFVGRKQTYIIGSRVHQFWKWNETTNSLTGAMGTTPITWNKTTSNGSTVFLVGVSGDPDNDDYIYIMTEDRKTQGGTPYKNVYNAGDVIRVYKLDYTGSRTSPLITEVFNASKPSLYFGGFCYHDGIFYIDYMDTPNNNTDVVLGKCYVYNATGELLDTIQFNGNTSKKGEQGTYAGEKTYMNGCSIIHMPIGPNEYSQRQTPADGLPRDYEVWITHSFWRKGVGQVIGRHPAYTDNGYVTASNEDFDKPAMTPLEYVIDD